MFVIENVTKTAVYSISNFPVIKLGLYMPSSPNDFIFSQCSQYMSATVYKTVLVIFCQLHE